MPRIHVLAGTNGAGKSSVAGEALHAAGAEFFNPDQVAREIRAANPGISGQDANAAAWNEGRRLLESAIARRLDFAFETTLGGDTITALLAEACAAGIEVHIWYMGLASPELHIERVRARVAGGGHDIPEISIRKRYDASRMNLIELLPGLASVRVYDNTKHANPIAGEAPHPELVLHMVTGRIKRVCAVDAVPTWAKPILMAAVLIDRRAPE